jgi:hypothetical protein
MSLKVYITWSGEASPLLPNALADVHVEADNTPVLPSASALGRREFELPDGVRRFVLRARFSASFGRVVGTPPQQPQMDVPPQQHEVLRIDQPFRVEDGTKVVPESIAAYKGAHPLVNVAAAANKNGVAVISLRTTFVNITPFWAAYAQHWSYYQKEHEPGTSLCVLGYTQGTPLIWFASIPDICQTSSMSSIATLVFFRPASYPYTAVNQPHQMSALARYLLAPKSDLSAPYWERDYIDGTQRYNLIRCSFEKSLVESKKAVVMIHPWPSGARFGEAINPGLPGLLNAALHLLWAEQRIGRGVSQVHLGRLGLSGFSRGGDGLWPALRSTIQRTDEVYGFDATGTADYAGTIVQWAMSRPESRLRLVGGAYRMVANESIVRTVKQMAGITSPDPLPRVTTVPLTEDGWKQGDNPYWDHVVKEAPDMRFDDDTRHQFAIFGGYRTFPPPILTTFLERFLRDSLYV